MTDNEEKAGQRWVDDVEKALNRTSEAVKAAWEGTRESRMSALERAKEAASGLGEAIDQGIELAKKSWGGPSEPGTDGDTETAPEDEPAAGAESATGSSEEE